MPRPVYATAAHHIFPHELDAQFCAFLEYAGFGEYSSGNTISLFVYSGFAQELQSQAVQNGNCFNAAAAQRCPSSYKMEHQSGLSFGGSGSLA